jgi:tetratricopeptide (TPR) repeat protein
MAPRFFLLLLALCGWALLGCRSVDRHSSSSAGTRKPPTAAETKEHAPDDPPVPLEKRAAAHAHYGAGVIHMMNREPEAAFREFRLALTQDPSAEDMALALSKQYLEAKEPQKAAELLNLASSRSGSSGAVFTWLGIAWLQLGKTNEAIAAHRTAIRKDPGSPVVYQNLYLQYLQAKQPQEAIRVADEAAAHAGTNVEFLLAVADMYINAGTQAAEQKKTADTKARAVLERVQKINPTLPGQRLQLAEALYAIADYTGAAALYLELLRNLPDVPVIREKVRARLTEIYLRGENREKATEQLRAMIKEDPANPLAHYWLGSVALDQGKFDEAIDNLNQCVLINPKLEQAWYDLARAQISADKGREALATLEKAREKFTANFVLEFLTGLAFSRQKAWDDSIQHYTEAEAVARATDPKRLTELFYFQFGSACERKGDFALAEKQFEKCIELAPNFAEGLNYLGYMWAEHGMKLDKARELIEKAVKLEPKNAAYLDSLGWVLFKLNQPKDGLQQILKAAEVSEKPDATIYDHLGDIYAALNQQEKAREAWRKSLSLEPNNGVRKKLGLEPEK